MTGLKILTKLLKRLIVCLELVDNLGRAVRTQLVDGLSASVVYRKKPETTHVSQLIDHTTLDFLKNLSRRNHR